MITDFHGDNLICPKCGSIRFRIDEDFEIKPLNSSKYDQMYDAVDHKTRFICSRCGEVVKEFGSSDFVKINYHGN